MSVVCAWWLEFSLVLAALCFSAVFLLVGVWVGGVKRVGETNFCPSCGKLL